jgi:hypothetical protein
VNKSYRECSQTSAMDETFLDRLHIDTPTPENVGNTPGHENIFGNIGNTSGQENIFGNFL